jgi:hypothetical protein
MVLQAKLVAAEAEVQKSESLSQAARILTETPGALQLRYLQSLDAIGQIFAKNSLNSFIFQYGPKIQYCLATSGGYDGLFLLKVFF